MLSSIISRTPGCAMASWCQCRCWSWQAAARAGVRRRLVAAQPLTLERWAHARTERTEGEEKDIAKTGFRQVLSPQQSIRVLPTAAKGSANHSHAPFRVVLEHGPSDHNGHSGTAEIKRPAWFWLTLASLRSTPVRTRLVRF